MGANLKTLAAWVIIAVVVTAGTAQAADGAVTKTFLRVRNLSCSSCLGKINAELHGYEGMINLDADLGQGVVMVQHKAPLTATTVAFVISDMGYPATVLSAAGVRGDDAAQGGQGQAASSGFGSGDCGDTGCSFGALPVWKLSTWQKVYHRYFGKKSNDRQ